MSPITVPEWVDELWVAWEVSLLRRDSLLPDNPASAAADHAEELAYRDLIAAVEANGLAYTDQDPRDWSHMKVAAS